MNYTELRRLSALRSIIEGFAARNAATQPTREARHSALLSTILGQLRTAVRKRDYPAFRKADAHLHETVVVAADVPLLREIWLTIWNGLQKFHQQSFEECFPDPRILIEEHEHLVNTIILGDPVAAEDAAQSHIEAVWFRLAEKQSEVAGQGSDPLKRAAAHLAFQLHSKIRLNYVATKVAFTSPGNLSHLFRQRYGLGFQRYLQKMRMEKAAELLSSTRLPVGSVARRVGYRDTSRFGQHFKRWFRTGPSQWRKRKRPTTSGHPENVPSA